MAIKIPCVHCGLRDVDEFRFGGELRSRPTFEASNEAWADYNFMRNNTAGIQKEWWFHRLGCGQWFQLERNTRSNQFTPAVK
jgi:sarcosine oxidase subunit delta